jgi:hypothetical protein
MHRAEQIVRAIAAEHRPTFDHVFIERSFSLSDIEEDLELPAVSIFVEDDAPTYAVEPDTLTLDGSISEDGLPLIDSRLVLAISLVASATTEEALSDLLFLLRAKSHVAIMADRTHALAFVVGTEYLGAAKPEKDLSGERAAGRLDTRWAVHYRMLSTTPE